MPTVPQGPLEGAEYHRLHFSREADDVQIVPGAWPPKRIEVMRISIGGADEIGYYFKFRGDPEHVVKVMEFMLEAAKQQLPRGRYEDLR